MEFEPEIRNEDRAGRTREQARDELEKQVEERTADLLESNRRLEREIAERQRVESMLRRQADELAVVNTLNRLIGASLSLDRVVEATLEGIQDCVGPDLTMLYFLEGDELVLQGARMTIPEPERFQPGVHPVGRCLCGLAAQEKRPFYSRDIRVDPLCTLAECSEAGLRSIAALPLLSGDQVLGVLGIASVSERDYGQQNTFWEALSSEVTIGVQNARLHRQLQDYTVELERQIAERARTESHLQERNRELALLSRSIQVLNSALATERVLASIIEQVRHLLGITACSVWLLDAEGQELICQQATGQKSETVIGWRLRLGEGLVGSAVQAGEILNVPDTRADERHYKAIDRQTGVELRSVLTVPLRVKGKVTGALQVTDGAPGRFGPTDVTLVELLALSAANALENARVHEALQESREELERRNRDLLVLNALATTISQSLSPEQVLSQSLDKVLELTRTDAAWAGLFGPEADSLSMAVNRGLSEATRRELEVAGLHRPENQAQIRSGEPMVMTALLPGPSTGDRDSANRLLATVVGVPIRARENVIGVLGSLFYQTSEVDVQDVQLLVAIGHQLGVAIENVRLLEEASEIEVLRDLDRMRSELIATASHELRTPLGLIRIFATALLMDEVTFDPGTHHQFLVGIADESEKLESILDNLLDLSRMESGRLLLDKRPVDLRGLVRDVMVGMNPELAGRQVVDLGDEPLSGEVDAGRIEQVLRNLLSNAVKYSPEGGAITVRACQAGDRISISVIDQGIGIPLEEQSRIFERFYRVDNDVTRRTRGAGLGLSICRWIVEAHDGSIWVQSEPGHGSEFRILLPAIV
jgi:K+-sensing histidine kinase KdpD